MKQKKRSKRRSIQKTLTALLCTLLMLGFFYVEEQFSTRRIPQDGEPAEFYANQLRDDIRQTFHEAISNAKDSVLLIIYTMTDSSLISALNERADHGIDVRVYYDGKEGATLKKKLSKKIKSTPVAAKNIMHQKILVVDNEKTWIGSANMTGESLRMHGNLVAGFYSPALAQQVVHNASTMLNAIEPAGEPYTQFVIGGQRVELSWQPHDTQGVDRLKQLMRAAEKTIKVAMFTWTRFDLAKEVLAAKNRGIDVQVVIDSTAGRGAGSKVVALLQVGGLPVRLSQGTGLLHHKFMYIDNKILVNGSANWTKAAFTENDDCFIILHDLTTEQIQHLEDLWDVIRTESALAE